MHRAGRLPSAMAICAALWATSVAGDEASDTAKIAALSDFTSKLDVLEQVVDDITVTGALALLTHEYPSWEFEGSGGFGSKVTGTSNDLGAVAASHEYNMSKLRGAIFRNKEATDEQREVALHLLAQVKDLILAGYEMEKLVEAGDMVLAGQLYREQILIQSDMVNGEIELLTKEIEQAIKFSAL